MNSRRISISILAYLIGVLVNLVWTPAASAQAVTEFAIPAPGGSHAAPPPNSGPLGLTTGPDGNLWFVESVGNKIGQMTTTGVITEFALPTADSSPQCIVSGPDGRLWFTEGNGNKIGRITTAGVVTEYRNPTAGWPQCLTVGPDGNLWFTDQGPIGKGAASGDGSIGRITTAGVITKFPVPTANSEPNFITAGPDGALWFTYGNDQGLGINKIGRITTAGVVSEFAIPTLGSSPACIAAGADGALWFAENAVSKIGRITTSGVFTEYELPASSNPYCIASGLDGALWFTEMGTPTPTGVVGGGQKIGRITTGGVITEYAIPTANSQPAFAAVGPDGAMWFTELGGNKIGRLSVASTNTLSVAAGWNLLGNDAAISVAASFNDAAKVNTVWKWVSTGSTPGVNYPTWALYTPTQSDGGLAYASSRGYDFLTTINGGEGFWIHAKTSFTAQVPSLR